MGNNNSAGNDASGVTEQWVNKVHHFSSQFAGWPATNLIGPSNTYPNYGDRNTAWAPGAINQVDYLELGFAQCVTPTRIDIYETFNPGFLKSIRYVIHTRITLKQPPVQVELF